MSSGTTGDVAMVQSPAIIPLLSHRRLDIPIRGTKASCAGLRDVQQFNSQANGDCLLGYSLFCVCCTRGDPVTPFRGRRLHDLSILFVTYIIPSMVQSCPTVGPSTSGSRRLKPRPPLRSSVLGHGPVQDLSKDRPFGRLRAGSSATQNLTGAGL